MFMFPLKGQKFTWCIKLLLIPGALPARLTRASLRKRLLILQIKIRKDSAQRVCKKTATK